MRRNLNQFYNQHKDSNNARKNEKTLNLILEIDNILIHLPMKDQNVMYEEEIEVIVNYFFYN